MPFERDFIRQLCKRQRVQDLIQGMSATWDLEAAIVAPDGTVLLGSALSEDTLSASVHLPIRGEDRQLAELVVRGATPDARRLAETARMWLEDLIELEQDITSLTSEVVHSYEELHLLYGLGSALGGVLDVDAARELILRTTIGPLGAAHAQLTLQQPSTRYNATRAVSVEGSSAAHNPSAQASASLMVGAKEIGSLTVIGKLDGNEFTSGDIKLLEGIAALAAPAIRNAQIYEIARVQADSDPLTGVYNHRCLQERLDDEFERATRYNHPLALILIDLDGFKLFNDVYGHPVGDRVLRMVANCLSANVRVVDVVGRYGGDEFMLILPETDAHGALEIARRVLDDVESREIVVNGQRLPVGLSLGIAAFPADSSNKHELIAHADTALYKSKQNGGRNVHVAEIPRSDWLANNGNTFSVLEGLVRAVDAKDHYTQEHSEVVTDAALLLAQRLHLADEAQRALRIAGLLHDVGKIGIPDHILKKPGKLTADEYAIMQQHVVLSELIIKGVPHLTDVLDAVAHHHERYDGRGYPYGKRGEAIPLLGRIMAIADAYSAMCMDRPYRKGMGWAAVRAELERGQGTQFDPELAAVFIAAMDEEHLGIGTVEGHEPPPVVTV